MARFRRSFPGLNRRLIATLGPVYFDNASNSPYEASLSTYNWTHVVGTNNNRLLIVSVGIFLTGTVSSVTLGAQNLTFLRADTNGAYRSELWYLLAPNSGSGTITVTLSTSLTSIAGAASYWNVDQTTPFSANSGTTGSNTPASASATPTSYNDRLFGSLAASSATGVTDHGGQALRYRAAGALGTLSAAEWGTVRTVASTTMQWDGLGSLDTWAVSIAAIQPVQVRLTASAGTYTLTGQSVTALVARIVNAAAGSYALSGTTASLLLKRVLNAVTGSYALSGRTVTMSVNRPITASAGSYTLSGASATLLFAHGMNATAGAYALSGQATTFVKAINLAAGAGSYGLNGTSATLLFSHNLVVSAGSYSLSGQAVTITVSRSVTVASGTYALSGKAASLVTNRVSLVSAGVYALSGRAATAAVARRLSATAGIYALTGMPALGGAAAYQLAANGGSYHLTGGSLKLLAAWKLAASVGVYAVTGSAANAISVATPSGTFIPTLRRRRR